MYYIRIVIKYVFKLYAYDIMNVDSIFYSIHGQSLQILTLAKPITREIVIEEVQYSSYLMSCDII
jgi:hypothetical protein